MKKVIIIGAGPGGYHAAIILAKAGVNVTVVDKSLIGGTCLNVGCIPTKTLLDQTSALEHLRELFKKKIFSIQGDTTTLNIEVENLRNFQSEVIKQLQQGLEKLFLKNKITLIRGKAKLLNGKKIEVKTEEGNKILEADEIIIATGSRPKNIPSFEIDGKTILNSDQVWNVPKIPKSLLVVGSGPIGVEFARVFNALGTKVTIAELQDIICPILDKEISENLSRSLKRRGITLKSSFATKLLEKRENSVQVQFISTKETLKETQEFEQILIAVGRTPNLENLGIEEIQLENNTFIKVNEYLETSVKNVWAIGDVTSYPQLAHTASFQARIVSKNILGAQKKFNGNLIPSCIFGYPEVAFIGKNEEQLKEENVEYKTGKFLYLASGKAKAGMHTEGLVKVLMDKTTKKILGCHIIGAEASSIIHEAVIAMQNDITVSQLAESIHAHPTYSEILLEALEDCLGEAVYS